MLERQAKRDAQNERDGKTSNDPELIPHGHADERPKHAPERGSVWPPPRLAVHVAIGHRLQIPDHGNTCTSPRFRVGRRMKVKSGCCAAALGGRVLVGASDDESKRRSRALGLPRDLLC